MIPQGDDENMEDPTEQEVDEENNPDEDDAEFSSDRREHIGHRDTLRRGHVYKAMSIGSLNPPMSKRERFRDWVLRLLDRPSFQVAGLVVLFLVVADGALFFFFLMGWQTLCDTPSKTDCEPRNQIYNVSVQILTGLFTYMATVSMPWRTTNFIQIFGCGIRNNSRGLDLYGRPTNEIWFHHSWCNRAGIIVCLMLNCLLQYANQATRIIFHTYESQATHPGNKWVNIFFGTSFAFAGIGALWGIICSELLRKQYPGRFGPGGMHIINKYWLLFWSKVLCRPQLMEKYKAEEEVELDQGDIELRQAEEEDDEEDPTRYPFNLLGVQRAGLRLFGM